MRRVLILGGAGAGKTTRLLKIMEGALRSGVSPGALAFVSFTNAAVDEARGRACTSFGLAPHDLPHFRTVHSEAFRQLGLRRSDVLGDDHLAELSEVTGELVTGDASTEGPAAGMNADPLLTIDHYARTTGVSLEDAWRHHGGDVDWFRLKRFSEAYRIYKEDRGLVDFTDMLSIYADGRSPPLPVEVAIVDEAQDLSLRQHAVIARAYANAREIYVAGDDCQSIHRWAGAAEDLFLSLADTHEVEVLPLSHRLPKRIFALSQSIASRITRRYEKETTCSDREGSVEWLARPDEVELGSGSWLMLARTRAQLAGLEEIARGQGVVYSVKGRSSVDAREVRAIMAYEALRAGKTVEADDARAAIRACGSRVVVPDGDVDAKGLRVDVSVIWHDALTSIPLSTREYYLACLRRKEKLTAEPRVRIETIHGSKGAEAQSVLLITDMTRRTHRGYELDPDSEHRVYYVGATRASEALYLAAPQGPLGYPM